jgi:UDP-N-acetylmuramoyl-tripeptide--D-alanyl-D-alanine ligase
VRLRSLDDIAAVEAALDAGTDPAQLLGDDVVLLDASADRGADALLRGLRVLAALGRAGRRSLAVVGAVEGADWEEHDRIGRVVVRLDVRRLVVAGDDARHLASAAGLEGSWDGESVLVGDARAAYDVLRAEIREGDVVLVTLPGAPAFAESIGAPVA